jgi:MFS family permease
LQGPILETLGEISKIPWVGIGFPMGSAAIIFLLGYLFRHFEYKRIFVVSILLFEIGSAVCGSAPSMNALIVGRVIAGMGGAGIYLA